MIMSRRQLLATVPGLAAATLATSRAAIGEVMPERSTFELRQYTLRARQRDTLISLFEGQFIEPQNEAGAHVVGTFRDADDPDRFVWIRGFADMAARPGALAAFYGGPVWRAHRDAANATMVDSDNVLLLRPAAPGAGFAPPVPLGEPAAGVVGATIYYLASADAGGFAAFFGGAVSPLLKALGVAPLAILVSEEAPNNFPRLPVRQQERVFVWFARWPSLDSYEACRARFSQVSGWRDTAPVAMLPALMRKPEQLRLLPTERSELR